MWTQTRSVRYGVAIYNFDGRVKHGISLTIGDTVAIREECLGWYRGFQLKNKSAKGIFPISYVALKECSFDAEDSDNMPIAIQDPVVREVTYILREWSVWWKRLYMDRKGERFAMIGEVMHELIDFRSDLMSGNLSNIQTRELKATITSKIDWGNKILGLDLVPRIDGEQVNADKTNPIELFRLHQQSTASSQGASVRGSIRRKPIQNRIIIHQLLMTLSQCMNATGHDFETHFSLYDAQTMRPFSERLVYQVKRATAATAVTDHQTHCISVFTDLGQRDIEREVFLVVFAYQIGSLKESDSSKAPTMAYKRPYGCGVQKISDIFHNVTDKEDGASSNAGEKVFNLKITQCGESEFAQQHENLIKRQANITGKNPGSFNITCSMRLLRGNLDKLKEDDPKQFRGVTIINMMSCSDVIMPDTLRNDLYLTLARAEFERGSKTASKNIELRVCIVDKQGIHITGCISPGASCPMSNEYNSGVFYHCNSPRWNETIRLAIPVEMFSGSHIRLEFRHCSRKDRMEKKLLGFSFVKLVNADSTTLCDGLHELFLYKCEDVNKIRTSANYLGMASSPAELTLDRNNFISHIPFHRSERELLYIETVLCSTKLTQNADLLALLRWKEHPEKIYSSLEKLIKLDGEETVKFLSDIMDTLFSILTEEASAGSATSVSTVNDLRTPLVFKALVHVFNLLEDNKFEHFKSVMEMYILNNLSALLAYRKLLSCLKDTLGDVMSSTSAPSVQEQFQRCFRALEYIGKCIVQSRLLHKRAYGYSSRDESEFRTLVVGVFEVMCKLLSLDSDVISRTQSALIQHLPVMLLQFTKLVPMVEVADLISKLVLSLPKNQTHPELDHTKLRFLKDIAKSDFFTVPESKSKLLPLFVAQLKRHLVTKLELKLCCAILQELLLSLHLDVKMKLDAKLNVQIVLEGLLDVIMPVILTIDQTNPVTGPLVACLMSMLRLMDEEHYRQLVLRYTDRQPLREFLIQMLNTFNSLVIKKVFPRDWLLMMMATNHLILLNMQLIAQTICSRFLSDSDFDYNLWKIYLHLAISFLTQPCLQLDQFSITKQQRIKHLYGDMRVRMSYEIVSMWQNLGDKKIQFIPGMVGHFLEMTLIPETELRNATIPIFFDMMECEQLKYGHFQQFENELIDKLDIYVSNSRGDYEYKELFNAIDYMSNALIAKVQDVSGWQQAGTAFVQSLARLLERLLDYRNILESEENREKRMTCTMNLLNFYKTEVNRKDMYIRYIYKLCDLHLACGNHTEAGFTLKLHADLLNWDDRALPGDTMYSAQPEWQRKETLYLRIIDEFGKGKSWEYGLPLCEELAEVYKGKILYEKLSANLVCQSAFYQNILHEHRHEPEYFRVGFFGQGFPPFLRNKEFIYRGNEYERLVAFQQRLQSEFDGATILGNNNPPSEQIKNGDGQYIQICNAKPIPEINPLFLADAVPCAVRNFYMVNGIRKFQIDRPFHRGEKNSQNEFQTLCLERITLKSTNSLPGLLRWFEVASCTTIQLSPIEVAIDKMESKNNELKTVVARYSVSAESSAGAVAPVINLNPLTMILNGVIDAAVMGGVTKYQEAFFSEEYRMQNPEHLDHLRQLKILFLEQIQILETALPLHKRLAPPDVRPLHQRLEKLFVSMKQKIKAPDTSGWSLPVNDQINFNSTDITSNPGSTMSLSSGSSPPHCSGSNRSSGVYCESSIDAGSVLNDLTALETSNHNGVVASPTTPSSTSVTSSPSLQGLVRAVTRVYRREIREVSPTRWYVNDRTESGLQIRPLSAELESQSRDQLNKDRPVPSIGNTHSSSSVKFNSKNSLSTPMLRHPSCEIQSEVRQSSISLNTFPDTRTHNACRDSAVNVGRNTNTRPTRVSPADPGHSGDKSLSTPTGRSNSESEQLVTDNKQSRQPTTACSNSEQRSPSQLKPAPPPRVTNSAAVQCKTFESSTNASIGFASRPQQISLAKGPNIASIQQALLSTQEQPRVGSPVRSIRASISPGKDSPVLNNNSSSTSPISSSVSSNTSPNHCSDVAKDEEVQQPPALPPKRSLSITNQPSVPLTAMRAAERTSCSVNSRIGSTTERTVPLPPVPARTSSASQQQEIELSTSPK